MAGEVVHGVDEGDVAVALRDVAAGEHPLLRGDHHFGRQLGDLAEEAGVVDEAGHVGGDEAVDHRAAADGLAGEDAGVDGRLGIVAHDAADELHAGGDLLAAVLHLHVAVGVFQVAVAGAGAEVDPASQVAVAQKAVVLLVGVGLDDRGFDLAADLGRVAERRRRP